jgi:hypothetical protein
MCSTSMSFIKPKTLKADNFSINYLLVKYFTFNLYLLKVHKHEIFFVTFFAETETIWSQGPVTRDF